MRKLTENEIKNVAGAGMSSYGSSYGSSSSSYGNSFDPHRKHKHHVKHSNKHNVKHSNHNPIRVY